MIPKRIKIKFHGPHYMATAHDAETDEPIQNVKRVDWVTSDVNNGVCEARLVVHIDEIEGEMVAPTHVTSTLSDADYDEIARRVERRIAQHARMAGVRRMS